MLDSKDTQLFDDIVRKIVKQEISNLNYTKTHPAIVTAVSADNTTASVKLAGDNTSTLPGLLNKTGEILAVNDEVIVYALNANLTNSFIGVRKGLRSLPSGSSLEAWQTPILLNSWVNYGGIYATAKYRKDSSGRVQLKGAIKTGIVGANIFVLPAGYRPTEQLSFAVDANNAHGRADVKPDGSVLLVVGNNTQVNLNNISFYVEQ